MSTDNSTAKPNIAICGCCRDCATPLPLVLNELSRIGSLANHLRWVFCENDSTDQSKYILGEFKKSHENVTLHFQDGLVARIPLRTERLALMRNLYLHSLRQDDSGIDWDILIVADLDNVNKSPISIEAVRQSIELVCDGKYAALFANSKPTYYDVWALRHPQWCPNDCWSEVRQSTDLDRNSAINKFVRSRQIEIDTDREFIEVDSAFGGLGIYKMSLALQSMYIGLDEEGNEKCEHVEFNKRIKSLSGQALAINPRLVNVSSLEHIARNTRFIPFKYRDDSILLECTIDHRLDSYMAGNPLYDRRLPLLALILHELNDDGQIMDVGANVGDTALLIRLSGCTLPIIAIEASSLFFEIMRRNVSRYPDLFGAIELVHSSVSCGQDNMSLVHGNGTAHLAAVYDVMPGNPESATSIIGLDEISSENVSLLKIDTDGFDAAIINANKDFLEHRQPILWVEADCASDTQLADWQTAMPALVSVYEYVIAFDNFGFAISAGKLTQKTSLLIDLISYCYQHKQMPTAQFGPPRIFYLDICFFPSSRVDEYRTFVSRLPEIQDCMASS